MRKLLLIFLLFAGIKGKTQTPNPGIIFYTTPAPTGLLALITSTPSGSTASNLTGEVGMKFTVGGSNITVDSLARWVVSGNSGTHTVRIADAAGVTVVSVSVNTSGAAVGFLYALITPTVLTAGADYYLLSDETFGADVWYADVPVTSTSAGTVTTSIIGVGGSLFPITPGSNSYGTVNIKYH